MSIAQVDLVGVGATQIAVGLSQVIRVTPAAFQQTSWLKIGAGGGTLEIVPVQLSGTSTAAGNAWGKGYALGATEVFKMDGAVTFYLAASGATMTADIVFGLTSGATLL